jgi:hypothetical protein
MDLAIFFDFRFQLLGGKGPLDRSKIHRLPRAARRGVAPFILRLDVQPVSSWSQILSHHAKNRSRQACDHCSSLMR